MKNSVTTFHVSEAPEHTMGPIDRTRCENTSSVKRLPTCYMCIPYWLQQSKKNSVSTFGSPNAPLYQNEIRDPHIPRDAKRQVHHNVFGCAFCGNCTGCTRARKIVCRRFAAHISHRMQKHKFNVMCPRALSWYPDQAQLSIRNSASMFRASNAPECTT
jgi:hypothetical protein